MTSDVYAGSIYYYDGWNALTVFYGDAHIAPFKVVHIGDVEGKEIISFLAEAGIKVETKIKLVTKDTYKELMGK